MHKSRLFFYLFFYFSLRHPLHGVLIFFSFLGEHIFRHIIDSYIAQLHALHAYIHAYKMVFSQVKQAICNVVHISTSTQSHTDEGTGILTHKCCTGHVHHMHLSTDSHETRHVWHVNHRVNAI